jgi:hypothetical protein
MPDNTAKVDRTTRWGNYAGREAADKSQSVAAFIRWVDTEATLEWKTAARSALRGKNLACWCKVGEPCHADYLLGWLNADIVGKGDAQIGKKPCSPADAHSVTCPPE